jgi:hypothetical protein
MSTYISTFMIVFSMLISQLCLADETHTHTSLDKKYEVTLNKEIDCPECAQALIAELKKVFKCQVQHPTATAKTNMLYFSSISVDIEEVKNELRNIGYEVTDVKTVAAAAPFLAEDIK